MNSINEIIKNGNLESYESIIKEKLKNIGMVKNHCDYVDFDSIKTTFNVFIKNPKPKSLDFWNLSRTYNSPTNYSEQNYIDAINLTNDLIQVVDIEWFDIFEIVLIESKLIFTKVNGYSLDTKNIENEKSIFSVKAENNIEINIEEIFGRY